jgi:Immune inhibitor A peptidase M6
MRKIVTFASVILFLCTNLAWSVDVQVTSNADSGAGSLRAALASASSGDTIVFALPADSTVTLASTLTVADNIAIDGAGASGLTISGNHIVPVLQISGTVTTTISNLTIASGGTGIVNQGTLTVLNCTILGNWNIGIANSGTLTVANSTFSGNASLTLGGGIKLTSGSATITNNTFVDNTAQYGGGIESGSSSNSTVTNNLFLANAASQFGGSINDAGGTINADHNLYWNNADMNGIPGLDCDGCASNTNAITADPLLGSLANNGGPTQTYLPGVGSAAIDSGDDATCAAPPINNLDQRGVLRPVGTHCDIGSVEFNDLIFANGFDPPTVYSTGFETCPSGWTLSGDWQCGVPQNVGPAMAFQGMNCLGTQIAANYSDNDTWAGTTATSPAIDLTGVVNPTLTFRMWVDTEGSTFDGADLLISTDGGVTYSVVTSVTPAYTLTVASLPAWGGHQAALGWQAVQADLSAYAGNIVLLRFGFSSDASGNYPGFYVDSFSVQ